MTTSGQIIEEYLEEAFDLVCDQFGDDVARNKPEVVASVLASIVAVDRTRMEEQKKNSAFEAAELLTHGFTMITDSLHSISDSIENNG